MHEKKIVYFGYKVPIGKYCWKFNGHSICGQFDNEGGLNECKLFGMFMDLKEDQDGILKDKRCLEAEATNETRVLYQGNL